MNKLDRKKKEAELMKMKSNVLDAEVQIEERKEEIERINNKIISFEERISQLEEDLKE